jgi:hypothetical protein
MTRRSAPNHLMRDNDIMHSPAHVWRAANDDVAPADRADEHANESAGQAEVMCDLATYLAAFLAIALTASLLVKMLGGG